MNMVIHDLRNPSNQIKFTIDQAIELIKLVKMKLNAS